MKTWKWRAVQNICSSVHTAVHLDILSYSDLSISRPTYQTVPARTVLVTHLVVRLINHSSFVSIDNRGFTGIKLLWNFSSSLLTSCI